MKHYQWNLVKVTIKINHEISIPCKRWELKMKFTSEVRSLQGNLWEIWIGKACWKKLLQLGQRKLPRKCVSSFTDPLGAKVNAECRNWLKFVVVATTDYGTHQTTTYKAPSLTCWQYEICCWERQKSLQKTTSNQNTECGAQIQWIHL